MFSLGAIVEPIKVEISRQEPSSHLPKAIFGFAAAAIWVFFALVALIMLREPLARFQSTVGGRLSKISFAGIELELAAAPSVQLNDDARSFGSMDPQNVATDSYNQTLKNALQGAPVPHSYAIINLGVGKSWLISRLFIFAVLLRLVRGVRCFVFVSGSTDPGLYLGTISTEDIHYTIVQRYPWLERVFAKAYKDQLWHPPLALPTKPITSQGVGMLEKDLAAAMAQEFVAMIKQDWNGEAQFPGITKEDNFSTFLTERPYELWVEVGTSKEYGAWIDDPMLLRDFSGVIQTQRVQLASSTQETIRRIVSSMAPYLAVVGDSGEFVSLIDRCKVLEELSRCPGSQS